MPRIDLRDTEVTLSGRVGIVLGTVTDITFKRCRIAPGVLDRLVEAQCLSHVTLENCDVGDNFFERMSHIATLKQLRITACASTTTGYQSMAGHCPDLVVLELYEEPGIDDSVIPIVAQHTRLKCLCLAGSGLVNPDLSVLSSLPLSEIMLERTLIGDSAIATLSNPTLYDLYLGGTQVTAAVLKVADSCPRLGRLYIPVGVVDEATLAEFALRHANVRVTRHDPVAGPPDSDDD